MEEQSKQLIVNGKTYILDLVRYPDATWEGRTSGRGTVYVVQTASGHDAKYFAHHAAYYNENIRRDQECENECESGWKQVPTGG